jgi:hypothetical protein
MSRAASTFRQNDITRAFKAAKAAGCKNPSVKIGKNGEILIIAEARDQEPTVSKNENEWDGVK